MGLVDMPFDVDNISIENGEAEAHTKIGWWRSVSNVPHGFAIQSFVAELAAAAGKDQKEFLLDLIGPARILDVPQKVKDFWDYGENPGGLPDRHRPAAQASSNSSPRSGGWGTRSAERSWPRSRRPPQLRQLCGDVVEAPLDERAAFTVTARRHRG